MKPEKKYLKGFNAGYLIAKHNPSLSWTLKQGLQENENPYIQGFLEGTFEFGREKLNDQMKSYDKGTDLDNERHR